ncbi:T7SS effector LXG polymorphic toxin [Bacillus changyiensis]|uniref:T7SS effector LXG polymorphic toxin n=1 Tax=Bacillus changyiensis TaxID=3004103 RepID=UPI0022E2B659|nr:T7SS effector LXG polymorphic toxin [Bacillus changyiensis]MDA1478264.1 T7SS effector LXG polymorphic toxin [Bacillus changyiensis]
MKTLDVKALREGIDKTLDELKVQSKKIAKIKKSVDGIVALDDALKGKGGEAIRNFYEECHTPFLRFYELFIKEYTSALKKIKKSLESLESHDDGFISQQFLENDLEDGLNKADRETKSMVSSTNEVIKRVKHIVDLPDLDDSEFDKHQKQALKEINDTLEKLNTFDREQTNELKTASNDLQTMKTYMKKLGKMYTSSGPRIEINTYKKGSILESEEKISNLTLMSQLDPEKKVDTDATSAIVTMLKKLEKTDPLSFNTVLRDKDDVRIYQKIHEKDNPLMGLLLKDTETYKKVKNVKKEYTDEELAELETKYQYFQDRWWRGYIDDGKVVKIEEVEIPKPNKNLVGISEFLDEITGYNDIIRATLGIDPKTLEKVSPTERGVSGALALPMNRLFKGVGMGVKWVFKGVKAEEILKAKKKLEKAIKELGKVEEKGSKKAGEVGKVEKEIESGKDVSKAIKGKYGEDVSKLGTGKVGDFTKLEGEEIDEILSRIPKDATRRELTPVRGKVTEGFEYKWSENGKTMRVRIHGPDASAPAGSNAKRNWVIRVQQGKKYLDPDTGKFQPPGITNKNSPNYSEDLANRTHIPIKNPK